MIGRLPNPASGVAFSPDGKQIAAGVSWNVEIYDVSDLVTLDICSETGIA